MTASLSFKPGPDDYSVEMLRQVFGPIVDQAAGVTGAAAGDSPLAAAMAVFLTGVVGVGMAFFVYLLVRSIYDTAQDGAFLGKQLGSIYMPLRLAAGVGLLLPLASGFNLLQVVVLWGSLQGVGLANKVGAVTLDAMQSRGSIAAPEMPNARGLAANVLKAEVCAAAYAADQAATGETGAIVLNKVPGEDALTYSWDGVGTSFRAERGVCGALTFTRQSAYTRLDDFPLPVGPAAANVGGMIRDRIAANRVRTDLERAHLVALDAMIAELRPAARSIVEGGAPSERLIVDTATRYESRITSALQATLTQARQEMLAQEDRFDEEILKKQGWIYWGAYYNHITASQDIVQQAANMLPTYADITIDENVVFNDRFRDAMVIVDTYIDAANDSAQRREQGTNGAPQCSISLRSLGSHEGVSAIIIGCLGSVTTGVVSSITKAIGGDNISHVAQARELGHAMINAGYLSIAVNVLAQLGLTNVATASVGGAGVGIGVIMPLFNGLLLYLWATGIYLAYYLPLIPFLVWLPAVLKWLVMVFEATIAAPLWAAAHIHPDGDERVGQAGAGYMLFLSVIMRPVLMVFGMLGAILLAHPMAGLINQTFLIAIGGSMSGDSVTGGLGAMAYVLIYCIAMTVMLHGLFSLVHYVPDQALRWVGSAIGVQGIGDREADQSSSVFWAGASTVRSGGASIKGAGRGKPPAGGASSGGDGGGDRGGGGGPRQRSEDERQREHQIS